MTPRRAQAGDFGAALRARREMPSKPFPLGRIEFVVNERNEQFLAVTHGYVRSLRKTCRRRRGYLPNVLSTPASCNCFRRTVSP